MVTLIPELAKFVIAHVQSVADIQMDTVKNVSTDTT
jgi:hypothetical protein